MSNSITKNNVSNDNKRKFLIFISLLIIVSSRFIPGPKGMSASAMQVLGVLIGTLILWLTLSIDWPSLLGLAGLAFIPEISFNGMIAGSIGSSTFSFLLFTFMCTYAISKTSFVKRTAVYFITSNVARRGPWWFLTLYCFSVLLIGLVMSPAVLFVIYLPIMEEICNLLKLEKDDKLANALIMGQTISCALSSGMTPIAHVFGIMAMGFYETATGQTINYAEYMGVGIPVGLIAFVGMMLIFKLFLKPDMSKFTDVDMNSLKEDIKPMNKREITILSIFFVVIALWVLPGIFEPIMPNISNYINAKGTAFPPLLGAVALFLITIDGKQLLDFKEVMSKGISWGSIIMAASTLGIGAAMTNSEIGLTDWLTTSIGPALEGMSPIVLVIIFLVWASIQTNLSSNMVTITVVCAVAIPIALTSNGLISAPGIAVLIGMMGAFAFAAPPAHPNVALAIGTGYTTTGQMLKYGSLMMVITVIAAAVVGYPLAVALMGY
ncbi:MAG TPA: SLC13 family permease [Gallicola sp.]|nr:SLC13 family permease [Gallicola sp.]